MNERLFGSFRRRCVTFAVAVGALFGSALVFGDFPLRPPARFFPDDITQKYGNTAAAPDFEIGWETVDASDHHLDIAAVAGSTADVVFNWDPNTDWGVANANGVRVQSADAASPTEWVRMLHDGTDGLLATGSGALNINPFTSMLQFPAATGAGSPRMLIRTSNTGSGGFEVGEVTTSTIYFRHFAAFEQAALIVDDLAGNQIVFGNSASPSDDFDHATTTNPTMFIHSDTDPDSDNTQWGSFAHDQTDFQIGTGKGDLVVTSAGGALEIGAATNLRRYHSCACNYNSGSINCVTGLAPDDFVVGCSLKVATVWDGNGTVDCKIDVGGSNITLQSFTNFALTSTGWMMFGSKVQGGPHDTYRALITGDDSVDCVATQGNSTQGVATMYVTIDKLN